MEFMFSSPLFILLESVFFLMSGQTHYDSFFRETKCILSWTVHMTPGFATDIMSAVINLVRAVAIARQAKGEKAHIKPNELRLYLGGTWYAGTEVNHILE